MGTAARRRQFQSLRRPVPAARVTDGLATGSLQVFPRGCACVCVPRTLAPALAADAGRGQIGGHLGTFEVPRKRRPWNHAHTSDTHGRPWGGSVALSRGALWVVAAVSGRKVPRYGRRDGAGSTTSRVCSAPGPAPPPTRPASARPLGWNLFLSAQGRVRRLGGDSEWGSEWRLVLAQGVQAACSSTVHPPSSWTPRPWF